MCVCIIYTHHIFIHSSLSRYLGYFHVLAIMNSAVLNMEVHIFLNYSLSKYIPRSRIAGSYGNSIIESLYCCPYWLHQFPFLPTVYEGFLLRNNLGLYPLREKWGFIRFLLVP